MVLVDTSVWVSYLRNGNVELSNLLNDGEVICYPFIIGELACGNLKNRSEILALLKLLPQVNTIEHEDALYFIENNDVMGKGLGYIDIHLAASSLISDVPIWTMDKNLERVANALKINYVPGCK